MLIERNTQQEGRDTMESKHTPGPWVAGSIDQYGSIHIIAPNSNAVDGHHVASCGYYNAKPTGNLIAAAPDLLEVCKEMLGALDTYDKRIKNPFARIRHNQIVNLKAAIAKAETI